MYYSPKIKDYQEYREKLNPNITIGYVPTMGALHAGHLSLMERAKRESDQVVVSIFVNPAQFGPGEDYNAYPRMLESDLELCRSVGVDYAFCPDQSEIYPNGKDNAVIIEPDPRLTECLCGANRPGHFTGVTTVLNILFEIIQPDKAYFGEKDYQQYLVVKEFAERLFPNISIAPCPIMREPSGLAMSSRNQYLSEAERAQATQIYQAVQLCKELIKQKQHYSVAVEESRRLLHDFDLEYYEIRDSETLYLTGRPPARLFFAGRLGSTRLIDNMEISIS